MASTDPHLVPHWSSAALVTIDMQRDFLSGGSLGVPGTTEVVPALRRLADVFRAAERPIVHVVRLYQPGGGNAERVRRTRLASGSPIVAPGSVGSQLAPGLLPDGASDLDHERLLAGQWQQLGPSEYAIFKPRWGAFFRTPLEQLLIQQHVDTIVMAGCNFPNCPRASLIEASERDYRLVLVVDAVSKSSPAGLQEVSDMGVELFTTQQAVEAVRFGAREPRPETGNAIADASGMGHAQ